MSKMITITATRFIDSTVYILYLREMIYIQAYGKIFSLSLFESLIPLPKNSGVGVGGGKGWRLIKGGLTGKL